VITNTGSAWSHVTASSSLGVHSGNYSAGLNWDYSHQDEWLIIRDVNVTGNLTFWSHAYQGSIHNDHYKVELSPDGGTTWELLLDMTNLPVYPSFNGYNQWETPYEIDMTPYLGQTVDIAWHAVDGDGQGLWYSWAIDDCFIGTDLISPASYDIYRKSDTILVDVITSVKPLSAIEKILIWPNPAKEKVFISSPGKISLLELRDTRGKLVFSTEIPLLYKASFNVQGIGSGIYILAISSGSGTSYSKVLIYR